MENPFEQYMEPIKTLNDLALSSIEKIAAIQVKAIQDNTKISIEAMKSASDIKDMDSLKKYLESQVSVAQSLSESAVKDAEKIAKLGESYVTEVQEVVKKSVPSV
jgi:phasin family protein